MPALHRQAVREALLPRSLRGQSPSLRGQSPSLRGQSPRSVPEAAPTPLQRQYVNLSVIALVAGVVAISALEMGAGLGHPLVKLSVLVGAPLLFATTADATVRIWRSAWAWMPVDRGRGLFRLSWVASSTTLLALVVAAAFLVLRA